MDRPAFDRRSNGWRYLLLAVAVGLLAFPIALFCIRRAAESSLTACQSELKNCASVLEVYASDNAGRYPPRLDLLLPNYLRVPPRCPQLKREYSYQFTLVHERQEFRLACPGSHAHYGPFVVFPLLREGYPQYSSTDGFVMP